MSHQQIRTDRRGPSRRVARRTVRLLARSGGRPGQVFDQMGQELHVVARVLTEDPDLADQLVVQAITAHLAGPCTLRDLAAAVHIAWLCWGTHPVPYVGTPTTGLTASDRMLHELHGLPDDQRAAIALCRFGGHTYREAAVQLGVSAAEAAELLRAAMQQLSTPRTSVAVAVPAA